MFVFSAFEIVVSNRFNWWIGLFEVEINDYDGYMIYLELREKTWKFDLLWLRSLLYNIRLYW